MVSYLSYPVNALVYIYCDVVNTEDTLYPYLIHEIPVTEV